MKNKPTLLIDAAIPQIATLCNSYAHVINLPSHEITAAAVKHADALFVRSVTKITPELLTHSRVKFVGSMTAGIDHIDTPWLNKNNIRFAYAPGANATAVAQYVICTLAFLQQNKLLATENLTVGIIGVGHAGGALFKNLTALGIKVLAHDPLRAKQEKHFHSSALSDLSRANVISLHVPLTTTGDFPTFHFIQHAFLDSLSANSILINTARGEVIATELLLNSGLTLCLDVFENEPHINQNLLHKALLSTPHIAGYSLESKLRATHAVFQKACDFFGWSPKSSLPNTPTHPLIALQATTWQEVVLRAYTPCTDSDALKKAPQHFATLRDHYQLRHEFTAFDVSAPNLTPEAQTMLTRLGFKFLQ